MKKEILSVLRQEIKWCRKNPTKQFSKDYQKGFMQGLRQSVFLATKVTKK